ncbi:hypothetical protein J7297_03091 [Nakaseomyces glabratus]|nr:hypothetical protein J7297_03091 [Nakaseomyces glabratus]KAH7587121.1 hypothetical protein J7296_02892 [Nakaseomyces glabratus]KAI8385139.1 hypothetical protein J6894_02882 [Nakaseomyces glabratus]KAI8395201.1 hypothetical protein J6895_02922 [Nakaseomyces glabratus]QNG14957.1 uncharacterized protein GWK60_J01903 [Nakaseomyces glabratus]
MLYSRRRYCTGSKDQCLSCTVARFEFYWCFAVHFRTY